MFFPNNVTSSYPYPLVLFTQKALNTSFFNLNTSTPYLNNLFLYYIIFYSSYVDLGCLNELLFNYKDNKSA